MTIKIASTTDTAEEITEAMTTEVNPSEISAPQADGVPSDEPTPEPSTEPIEAASEAPDEPADEEEDSRGTQPQVTVSDEDVDPVAQKPKRRRRGKSYKDRASQLAREKALEKNRADVLEAQLAQLQQARTAPPPPPDTPEASHEPGIVDEEEQVRPPDKEEKDGRPVQDDFDTYEAYQDAIVEWKVGARLTQYEADQHARIERDQAQRAQEEIVATHTARIDTFRSVHEDFDAVIEQGKDLPVTPPMRDAVLNSDAGPALMYHLCSNPDECDRIANMHPMAAIKEMGKLEAQIEAASQTGPSSSARPVTQAPPPIQPVGGGATTSTTPLDQLPYQEFKRIRNEQERVARERGS